MKIYSGNTVTEYGLTPAGQFYEKHQVGSNNTMVRVTNDPERFMQWMIKSEIAEEEIDRRRELLLKVIKVYWGLNFGDTVRGSFNEELYRKIIKIRKENGTLYR